MASLNFSLLQNYDFLKIFMGVVQYYYKMYFQFLHPELVLFGTFLNKTVKIDHDFQEIDDEIVIHQKIVRESSEKNTHSSFFSPKRQRIDQNSEYDDNLNSEEARFLQMNGLVQEQYEDDGEDDDDEDYQNEEDYDEKGEGYIEGYYGEDSSPYENEQYVYNMNEQDFPPNYLAEFLQNQNKFNKKKPKNIFLQPNQPLKNVEQDDDDDQWLTEQQEQNLVDTEKIQNKAEDLINQLGQV